MSKDISKVICPLPWMHISVQAGGIGRICCNGTSESLKDKQGNPSFWKTAKNIQSYFNTEDYKKIRLQMLKGERPSYCSRCFNNEEHGVKSVRQSYLESYQEIIDCLIVKTKQDGSIKEPNISYIDLTLGNRCNLQCKMCSPYSSYIIKNDYDKLGISYDNDIENIYSNPWYKYPSSFNLLKEVLKTTNTILITGGEPMLIKEHMNILKMIIDSGYSERISLLYHTNVTIVPDKFINLWKYFKRVLLRCSIDAYGELNEYIRYPSKWEQIIKNMWILDKMATINKNIDITIHSTIQAYNFTRIDDFLNYLYYANFKNVFKFPVITWVEYPQWMSPAIFPSHFKDKHCSKLNKFLEKYEKHLMNNDNYKDGTLSKSKARITSLKKTLKRVKNQEMDKKIFKKWIETTKAYDKMRNQSISNIVSEFTSFF